MKYFLKSCYPCLLKAGQTEFEIDETDIVEIEDENFLFVYPKQENFSFYINLACPVECEKFSILQQGKNSLIILENPPALTTSMKKNLLFNKNKCQVFANQKQIRFDSDTTSICLDKKSSSAPQQIFKINDYACVQFADDFYAFSVKKNKISHFKGKISFDGEKIKVNRFYSDSVLRQKTGEFCFDESNKLKNCEFVRNDLPQSPEIYPFCMLESVFAKDFELAFSFLDENLKSKIHPSQLADFFGNFSTFLPLSATEFITISQDSKNFVKFEMKNNKICDIEVEEVFSNSPEI